MKNITSNNENDAQGAYPQQGPLSSDNDIKIQVNQDINLESNTAPNNKQNGAKKEESKNMSDVNTKAANDDNEPLGELQATDTAKRAASSNLYAVRRIPELQDLIDFTKEHEQELLAEFPDLDTILKTFPEECAANVRSIATRWPWLTLLFGFRVKKNSKEGCRFKICQAENESGVLIAEQIQDKRFARVHKRSPFAFVVHNNHEGEKPEVIRVRTLWTFDRMGLVLPKKRFRCGGEIVFHDEDTGPLSIHCSRVVPFAISALP